MSEAVCTLFEKHYHHGVAGLTNSLVKAGFKGKIFCGYRGSLPYWTRSIEYSKEHNNLKVSQNVEIIFLSCDKIGTLHFTNYKPTFMLRLLNNEAKGVNQLHYLDPDIVLNCEWSTMRRWANEGISLAEDIGGYLPQNHPIRIGWIDWLSQHTNFSAKIKHDRYYSAGYIGVPAEAIGFLKKWEAIISDIGSSNDELKKLCTGKAESLFYLPDQDAMNMALMCENITVNGAGAESMGFAPAGRQPRLLFHAIGPQKPWQLGYIKMALRGYAPTHAARFFLKNIKGPISSLPPLQAALLKLDFRLAVQLSRIFKPTEYRFRNP